MATKSSSVIEFDRVSKTFSSKKGIVETLVDISFEVKENEFTTILGPSGCGKTTILRLCSGLSHYNKGSIHVKGKLIKGGINTEVGFVTQDSNLFPWLTLQGNVEFPLVIRGVSKAERLRRTAEYIALVGLTGFERHYPFELSGGMQKRASIIRTMIYEPDVILMDEPFGALDAQTRMVLQNELLKIWDVKKKTILFITHDLREAVALSDKVILLTNRPAKIKQVFQIPLERPRNVFEIHNLPEFNELYNQIWAHFKGEIRM